jgi:hypothetical protein
MTETNQDKLLARIKALLSKTVEAGATEAEEMTSAAKARELIEKYQLDLGAEELRREGFVRKTIEAESVRFAFARRILLAINEFCEVKTWTEGFRGIIPTRICVLGLASDAEFAGYLIESLANFALAGAGLHVAAARKMAIAVAAPMTAAESREAYRSYLLGCANRISLRLREMARQRKAQMPSAGSYGALIQLDKPALIDAEMDRLGIHLRKGSGLTGGGDRGSFEAGQKHGAKASFGRPVAGGHIAGLIERK